MYIIRPVEKKDKDSIIHLIVDGALGITSLPRNKLNIPKKIQLSLESFHPNILAPQNEHYFFVLQNLYTGEIGGCCAIYSRSGVLEPDYYYKIETVHPEQSMPQIPKSIEILHPLSISNGPSMVCSLFLSPEHRKEGLGRLLSLSRFLFIASHPHRFEKIITADIRGVIDEKGNCPFWDSLGRHFLNADFNTVLSMVEENKRIIPNILPKHPIYKFLLSKEAQEALGKTHIHSRAALTMLEDEGFKINDEVDIFDGGPQIKAELSEIRIIKFHTQGIVTEISKEPLESDRFLMCNTRLDFRACMGYLKLDSNHNVILPSEFAAALKVKIGDSIRFATPSPPPFYNKEKN